MSDIHGQGYGDKHDWIRGFTNRTSYYKDKFTSYSCRKCGAEFDHYYDIIVDIFLAIENAGIPEECLKSEHNLS